MNHEAQFVLSKMQHTKQNHPKISQTIQQTKNKLNETKINTKSFDLMKLIYFEREK